MKRINSIIFLVMLCVHSVQAEKLTAADYNLLRRALNATLAGTTNFIPSKTEKELEHIVVLSNKVLSDATILQTYSDDLKQSPALLRTAFNNLKQKIAATLKKQKASAALKKQKAAAAVKKQKTKQTKKPTEAATIFPILKEKLTLSEANLLRETLNAALAGDVNFIPSKTEKVLEEIIVLSDKALSDATILQRYSDELKRSPTELKFILNAFKYNINVALQRPSEPDQELKAIGLKQYHDSILANAAQALAQEKAASTSESVVAVQEQRAEQEQQAGVAEAPAAAELVPQQFLYTLYIMLDIPKKNDQEKPIDWKKTTDSLVKQLNDTKFNEQTYHHISLMRYENRQPLTEEFLIKVEKALSQATEILKIIYPNGIERISLVDGGVTLGENAIAFRVAESRNMKIMQEIILKFISFEGITGFKINTFEKKLPLHATLGRIPSKLSNLKAIVSTLDAPDGSRESQRETFTVDTFRASYKSGSKQYRAIGQYAF